MRASDRTFVLTLLSRLDLEDSIMSDPVPEANLCMKCQSMDFHAQEFYITDTLEELRRDANICDFCQMRWDVGKDHFSHGVGSILFERVDSELQLNRQPVISFLACRESLGAFSGPCDENSTHRPRSSLATNTKSCTRF